MKTTLTAFLHLLLIAVPLSAEMTAGELVDRANQLLRGQSSHAVVTMRISTKKWERTLEVETWNQGRDKALMRIHSPAKERGNGTLKIEKEIWHPERIKPVIVRIMRFGVDKLSVFHDHPPPQSATPPRTRRSSHADIPAPPRCAPA